MFDADGYFLSLIGAFDTNALSCLGASARPFQDPSARTSKAFRTQRVQGATLLVVLSTIVGWLQIDAKEKKGSHPLNDPQTQKAFDRVDRDSAIRCQTSTLRSGFNASTSTY